MRPPSPGWRLVFLSESSQAGGVASIVSSDNTAGLIITARISHQYQDLQEYHSQSKPDLLYVMFVKIFSNVSGNDRKKKQNNNFVKNMKKKNRETNGFTL